MRAAACAVLQNWTFYFKRPTELVRPRTVFQRLPFSRELLLSPAGESWELELGPPLFPTNLDTSLEHYKPSTYYPVITLFLSPSLASFIASITIPVFSPGSLKLNVGKSGELRPFPQRLTIWVRWTPQQRVLPTRGLPHIGA